MLPRANFKEIILWLLRRRRRLRIFGHSMEPLLTEDDEVLVKYFKQSGTIFNRGEAKAVGRPFLLHRAGSRSKTKIGFDIVVAEHPHRPGFLLIKQWDGKGLKSWCHKECAFATARIMGIVTSRI